MQLFSSHGDSQYYSDGTWGPCLQEMKAKVDSRGKEKAAMQKTLTATIKKAEALERSGHAALHRAAAAEAREGAAQTEVNSHAATITSLQSQLEVGVAVHAKLSTRACSGKQSRYKTDNGQHG